MKEIIISGGSDDLIEVDGEIRDEFDAYEAGDPGGATLALRVAGETVARVRCFYDGYWCFAFVGTVDEDGDSAVVMPEGWRVETRATGSREGTVAPYSMSLHIFVPDEVEVTIRGAGDADEDGDDGDD